MHAWFPHINNIIIMLLEGKEVGFVCRKPF